MVRGLRGRRAVKRTALLTTLFIGGLGCFGCSSGAKAPPGPGSPDASPVQQDTGVASAPDSGGGTPDAGFSPDASPPDAGEAPIHPTWQMKTGTPPPSGRWGTPMVFVPDGKRFVFF